MKLACVRAIAELAKADDRDVVAAAYGRQDLRFGPDYLIPTPFDPRLITAHRAGRGQGGDAESASRRGRSPTSRPTAQRCSASSTTPAW